MTRKDWRERTESIILRSLNECNRQTDMTSYRCSRTHTKRVKVDSLKAVVLISKYAWQSPRLYRVDHLPNHQNHLNQLNSKITPKGDLILRCIFSPTLKKQSKVFPEKAKTSTSQRGKAIMTFSLFGSKSTETASLPFAFLLLLNDIRIVFWFESKQATLAKALFLNRKICPGA